MKTENVTYRKICLETLKSRVPGYVPFLMDSGTCNLSGESQDGLEGNYGKIPFDVEIPQRIAVSITDDTDINILVPVDKEDISQGFLTLEMYGNGTYPSLTTNPNPSERSMYLTATKDESGKTHYQIYKYAAGQYIPFKYLTYRSMMKWFRFFKGYREGLRKGDGTHYANYMELYRRITASTNPYEYSGYYEDMDSEYSAKGGSLMDEWIRTECVPYESVTVNGKASDMYLSEIKRRVSVLEPLYRKYSGISEYQCSQQDDCCECGRYFALGGNEFYEAYSGAIGRFPSVKSSTNVATMTIPVMIDASDEVIGVFRSVSEEWSPYSAYSSGSFASFEGEDYILVSGSGFNYDSRHSKVIFGNLDPNSWTLSGGYEFLPEDRWMWKKGTRLAKESGMRSADHQGEIPLPAQNPYLLSGTTSSRLSSLMDSKVSDVDSYGNQLGCVFPPGTDPGSYYPQNGELFDIPYHVGNRVVSEMVSSGQTGDTVEKTYFGSLLTGMSFKVKDSSGNAVASFDVRDASGNISALMSCERVMSGLTGCHVECEFSYSIGCLFRSSCQTGSSQAYYALDDTNPGISYVESIPLVENHSKYRLSPFEYRMIRHYSLAPEYVEVTTENGNVETRQASFSCTADTGDVTYTYSPLYRDDRMFGLLSTPEQSREIYVDRGMVSPRELMMRLGEVRSVEALDKYGNGYF